MGQSLLHDDPNEALFEAFKVIDGYREMVPVLLDQLSRETKQNRELQARLREVLDENARLRAAQK